jgi:hypothetical protein
MADVSYPKRKRGGAAVMETTYLVIIMYVLSGLLGYALGRIVGLLVQILKEVRKFNREILIDLEKLDREEEAI